MSKRHLIRATLYLSVLVLAGCNTLVSKPIVNADTHPTPQSKFALTPEISVPEVLIEMAKAHPFEQTEAKSETSILDIKPLPPTNLWVRLRQGLRLDLAEGNPRVERDVKWYAKHDKYLLRVQDRATPYLYFILEEIEKRQMPTEFALLPVVESAFKPFAYSPGQAAGLWQFIPSTGKMYHLKQNWWYDGRRDVVTSTRAALDYLSSLAKRFDGDWELALAAYNAGAGTVRKAIKRNIKKGKPTDYWNLDLPKETMAYVPRFLAISRLVKSPDEHGITLKPIHNAPYFASINTKSQIDLALAAEMADISIETLYQLNPGFNRWATAPNGPHRLNVPTLVAEHFQQKISQLPIDKRMSWTRYKIKPGDSLGIIAEKHGTTVALLKQSNKLKNHRIRAGKHLLIPTSSKLASTYTHSSAQRLASKQNKKGKGNRKIYKVRSGDTLWELAKRYNISHKKIARWNDIAPGDTLRLGQKLVIWSHAKRANYSRPITASAINAQSSIRYRVRKGDSLALIANKFRVSVADLRKWNSLPGKYLQPGQRIQLYVDVNEQTSSL